MSRKKSKIVIEKCGGKSTLQEPSSLDNVRVMKQEVRTIMTIFREIDDVHSHERLLTQLMLEFYDKLTIDEFCQDFFECMRHIMIYQDRIKTDIPFIFCVKFVILCLRKEMNNISTVKSNLLLKRIVKYITWYESTVDTNIRFHSVQVSRILLTELTDDIPVPELLFEKIQNLLLKRFWDIKSYVRAEAARASSRLQDPADPDCPIVVGLMHLSRFDSSHTVRLSAMQALAITTKTLPCIVARIRDINDLVRKKSFELLAKWKILKPLTVSKRLQIVESGLTDKSDIVKTACKELLRVWLVASNNDPVALLKRFDVENREETTELAFTSLLANLSSAEVCSIVDHLHGLMDDRRLVHEDKLDAEVAFLWKHLMIFLNEQTDKYENYLDKIVPSVPDFEQYLRRLFQKPIDQNIQKEISLDEYAEYCTVIKQLLPIVKYIDVFDLYNRQKIIDLIKWAMSSTYIPFNYVEHLMKLLVHLESNNVKICDETVALINDLLFDNDANIDTNVTAVVNEDISDSVARNEAVTSTVRQEDSNTDHTVINKEALRKKRIEIAELDVKINELKEMITISMQAKEFDGVQLMVNELMILESKKTELVTIKDQMMSPVKEKKNPDVDVEPVENATCIKTEIHDNPSWMNAGMESRIIKANIMTITMIQECNLLWTMPPSLRSLVDNVILISVRHVDACVRQKAILSLGLCCILDRELAVKYYPIFLKSLEVDHDSIKEVAVKSLIDLFIRFGIEPFQDTLIAAKETSKLAMDQSSVTSDHVSASKGQLLGSITEDSFATTNDNTFGSITLTEEEQNKCVAELLNPIIVLLNSDKIELQTAASIGLSKLLYHHKLMSSKLLSRLLLLWFNPETENNVLLRQHLGGFFSNYTLMSLTNQESITNCFLITMRTLFKASASSSLSEVDVNNVVEFFLRVTDSRYLLENRTRKNKGDDNISNNALTKDDSQTENPCHNELALIISNQILKAPLSSEVKYYVSMLVRLRLCSDDVNVLRNIESLITMIIKKLKDKKSLQLLYKFHKEVLLKLGLGNSETEQRSVIDESLLIPGQSVPNELIQTPIGKPVFLEVNTVGKPQEGRFLSHCTLLNVDSSMVSDDGMSEVSSIHADDTVVDRTMMEEDPVNEVSARDNESSLPTSTNTHDDVFKKPRNVRVTRSSSRYSGSIASGDCSLSSSATCSNSKVIRKLNVRRQ